jgi:hypothetical protein
METSGKIAVITGAGSGIGRATALALYADGFSVVLAGRRREMLEETAALARAAPPKMLVVPTDRPSLDRIIVRHGEGDLWPDRSFVQQRRHQYPQYAVRGFDRRTMVERRRGQFDRLVPMRAARIPHDEEPGTARWSHHQQPHAAMPRLSHPGDCDTAASSLASEPRAGSAAGGSHVRRRPR